MKRHRESFLSNKFRVVEVFVKDFVVGFLL